jgi:hypothetical protein
MSETERSSALDETYEAIRRISQNDTIGSQHAARMKLREIATQADAYRGAVGLLATIGQLANTNESLDDGAMVRVPLRLLRAARDAGGR